MFEINPVDHLQPLETILMGNCCWIFPSFYRNNRVGEDQDNDTESNSLESQFYTERVTHIVADIHERILHKVKLIALPPHYTLARGTVM